MEQSKPPATWHVTVTVPAQLSEYVGLGRTTGSLQLTVRSVSILVKVGGIKSSVYVNVCRHVEVLPQASVALNVYDLDLVQPDTTTGAPREETVTVGVPQLSVAVAVPGFGQVVGLHPRSLPGGQVMPGATRSST